MCGLVGFLAPHLTSLQRRILLKNLLKASQTRGNDATGIAFVDSSGMQILKKPMEASEFCNEKDFIKMIKNLPPVVIGHTRAASRTGSHTTFNKTTGGDKLSLPEHNPNNHPFYSRLTGVALAHNGFLDRGFWEKSAGDDENNILLPFESTTDSEVALRVLEAFILADGDRLSMLDCIDNLCLNVSGSYAYAILQEKDPNSLWLVKKDKPLFVAWIPVYKALVFASEKDIIEKALTEYDFEEFFNYIMHSTAVVPDHYLETVKEKTAIQITLNVDAEPNELFEFTEITITPTNAEYDFHRKVYEKRTETADDVDETEDTVKSTVGATDEAN